MYIIQKIERWIVVDEDGHGWLKNGHGEARQFASRAAAQFAADDINKMED